MSCVRGRCGSAGESKECAVGLTGVDLAVKAAQLRARLAVYLTLPAAAGNLSQ